MLTRILKRNVSDNIKRLPFFELFSFNVQALGEGWWRPGLIPMAQGDENAQVLKSSLDQRSKENNFDAERECCSFNFPDFR